MFGILKKVFNVFNQLKYRISDDFDEGKWKQAFEKLYKNLYLMEKNKYLAPKFSQSLGELADCLGVQTVILLFHLNNVT